MTKTSKKRLPECQTRPSDPGSPPDHTFPHRRHVRKGYGTKENDVKKLIYAAGVAALGMALQANAALLLDTTVTSSFLPGGGLDPGNDLPNSPPAVRFGQLKATEDGQVSFYFTGSEA